MEKVTKEAKINVLRFYGTELILILAFIFVAKIFNLRTYFWGFAQGLLVALLTGFVVVYPQIKKALK